MTAQLHSSRLIHAFSMTVQGIVSGPIVSRRGSSHIDGEYHRDNESVSQDFRNLYNTRVDSEVLLFSKSNLDILDFLASHHHGARQHLHQRRHRCPYLQRGECPCTQFMRWSVIVCAYTHEYLRSLNQPLHTPIYVTRHIS